MAPQWRSLTALAEEPSPISSTHMTAHTVCHTSPRGPSILFWLPRALLAHGAQTHKQTRHTYTPNISFNTAQVRDSKTQIRNGQTSLRNGERSKWGDDRSGPKAQKRSHARNQNIRKHRKKQKRKNSEEERGRRQTSWRMCDGSPERRGLNKSGRIHI